MPRGGNPWTRTEILRLRELVEAGIKDAAIADALGNTHTTRAVAVKRYQLGLVSRRIKRDAPSSSAKWENERISLLERELQASRRRELYLQNALELALALADTRAEPSEIASEIRHALERRAEI